MAESCRFGSSCGVSNEVAELTGVCEVVPGKTCGAAAAYTTLLGTYGSLSGLDQESLITGLFTFSRAPRGMPRLARPADWVGATLPVRQVAEQPEAHVDVNPADAVLGMMASGRLAVAAWFTHSLNALDVSSPDVRLQRADGMLVPVGPITSIEYYGGLVNDPDVIGAINAALISAR